MATPTIRHRAEHRPTWRLALRRITYKLRSFLAALTWLALLMAVPVSLIAGATATDQTPNTWLMSFALILCALAVLGVAAGGLHPSVGRRHR